VNVRIELGYVRGPINMFRDSDEGKPAGRCPRAENDKGLVPFNDMDRFRFSGPLESRRKSESLKANVGHIAGIHATCSNEKIKCHSRDYIGYQCQPCGAGADGLAIKAMGASNSL